MVSTFGCSNGLILAGARAYYAMARDGLFFRASGRLNDAKVPAWGLMLQGLWAVVLVLPRTYDPATRAYGNLYNNLLDYVVSAALIFYILTIAGIFRLRRRRGLMPTARIARSAIRWSPRSTSPARRRSCSCCSCIARRPRGRGWSSCCSACRCILRGSRRGG